MTTAASNDDVQALLAPWSGPCGGLPPFDKATPETIGRAYEIALARRRAAVLEIAANTAAPTFENTIAALEESGGELRRIEALYQVYANTLSSPALQEVAKRVVPLAAALEDEVAQFAGLLLRVDHVLQTWDSLGLSREQRRLTEVTRDRLIRGGAALPPDAQLRLKDINARLAALMARFSSNIVAEHDAQALFLQQSADLDGLTAEQQAAAAAAARQKGRPGQWAIPNLRPSVWAFLTNATRRDRREQVWRMWVSRNANSNDRDNCQIANEILKLRGEKARLFGYPTFAHFALAARMLSSPETVAKLLDQVWQRIVGPTRARLAELQDLAAADDPAIRLEPWDHLYYMERLRRQRFGVDGEAVRHYLSLDAIVEAMLDAASRLHGLNFRLLPEAPVCDPAVRVYEVCSGEDTLGVLYLDLYERPGKMRGSFQHEYRAAESFHGRVPPISSVNSSVPWPQTGRPALLTWEHARTLFHELGHALHMLSCKARHPSLGSLRVAWDFVELPALLNERWLHDRALLERFARHDGTGEPIAESLVQAIERAVRFDRVFSVTLEYLCTAIVDLRIHLAADGREVDAARLEQEILAEIRMPHALDPILRVPHAVHTFSDAYAAGVYAYLWSDVMAADVAEAFAEAPGGFYDRGIAARWRDSILEVGHVTAADEAFRNFRGRDPDIEALMRRFGLTAAEESARA